MTDIQDPKTLPDELQLILSNEMKNWYLLTAAFSNCLRCKKNICSVQVFGEIAHFLIATTSKDVARDVHYGDQVGYWNFDHQ